MIAMLPIELKGFSQACIQISGWLPADDAGDFVDVGVEVTRLLRFALSRELGERPRALLGDGNYFLHQLAEANRNRRTDVEYFSICCRCYGRTHDCLDAIVHITKVSQDGAVTVHLNGCVIQ